MNPAYQIVGLNTWIETDSPNPSKLWRDLERPLITHDQALARRVDAAAYEPLAHQPYVHPWQGYYGEWITMTEQVDDLFSFGTWVRRRRKALDLTQAALAHRVGCAEVTIRKLEGEVFRPSREMAERLADCLGIPSDERAVFLQAARGERAVDRLPPPTAQIDLTSRLLIQAQPPVISIPIDTIPYPAPLPAGSRMPLSPNPLFVGREAALRQLATALQVDRATTIGQMEIAATTGVGGIGKTQLACEFVHRYGQYFHGGVFWLSFADPSAIPAEVAACGGADGMFLHPEFGTLPLDEQVKLVLAAWESTSVRLLVFDNCEEEDLLDQWRPKHGNCQVLLTSRRRYWAPVLGVHAYPLDALSRTDSIALLRTFRPDLAADDADLHTIGETLGDLPLALHLVGSFLAKYRHAITPAQYLARLHVPTLLHDRSLREAGLSPTKHVQHVARTFEQSYERLDLTDPTDTLALTLLSHVACFAPGEPLPRSLLLQTVKLLDNDADGILLAEDALIRLIDLGLLETYATGDLRLHRLLVAFVRAVVGHEVAQAAVEATILQVVDDLNERHDPRPVLAIQPHLRFIAEAAHVRKDARSASLYTALGIHVRQLGMYAEAQDYHAQAVVIHQHVLGADHPDTARSLHYLGVVFYFQGQYAEAQHCFEQALAIRQQVLGTDHPLTSASLSNLAGVLMQQGHHAKAQNYFEQALANFEQMFGENHSRTADSLTNLGLLLMQQGQYAQAQNYHERALAIYQLVLGTNHPSTATSLDSLGRVLQAQGQHQKAQCYFEQALVIAEQALGLDHPDTATILNNLGSVFQDQGQYAEAQRYYEQALAIRKQMLGTEHPDTARSLMGLGEVLHAQEGGAIA